MPDTLQPRRDSLISLLRFGGKGAWGGSLRGGVFRSKRRRRDSSSRRLGPDAKVVHANGPLWSEVLEHQCVPEEIRHGLDQREVTP
jgi:hypothetical protein